MPNSTLRLSKLDAASRQLETAINLYFQDGDPVAIHTLACAAHEIIQTLNAKAGGAPTIKQGVRAAVKPEFRNEVAAKMDAARNFFKHADRDPTALLEFSERECEFPILDACLTYQQMTAGLPPLVGTFLMWCALTWGRQFLQFPGMDPDGPVGSALALMSRSEYFDYIVPIAIEEAERFTKSSASSDDP